MEMTQEMKIQYQNTQETSKVTIKHYDDIEFYRRSLFQTQILSHDEEGNFSYGNMSKRAKDLEFVITASRTGNIAELLTKHYVHIKSCHPTKSLIETIGFANPSGDALVHYYIYETRPDITHVFHGYDINVWNHLIENDYPVIPEDLQLNDPEFINALKGLIQKDDKGIFALKGHYGGFFSYASDGRKASRQIKKILNLFSEPEEI